MAKLIVGSNQEREIINITSHITRGLPSGSGIVTVFAQHTSAAIAIIDLDPGTDLDFLDYMTKMVPKVNWRHPYDPQHTPDHMMAGLLGPSESIPYENGALLLGAWQRVVLIEFDGPRNRSVVVSY